MLKRPTEFCVNSEAHRRRLKESSLNEESCLSQLLASQTLSGVDVAGAAEIYRKLSEKGDWHESLRSKMMSNSVDSMTENEKSLSDFLLSACLKDCSIMMTFGSSAYKGGFAVKSKIKIIDTDPKPISRIPHYLELDEIIREIDRNVT